MAKTKIERETEAKKEAAEAEEHLRQVDKRTGRDYIADIEKEKVKDEKIKKDDAKSDLQTKRGRDFTYIRTLAGYGFKRLLDVGFEGGWEYHCLPTDGTPINLYGKQFGTKYGVLVIVKSPKGNVYARGITATQIPEYDAHAVEILVYQAENVMDSEKGLLLSDNKDTAGTLKKTKSGIFLPN